MFTFSLVATFAALLVFSTPVVSAVILALVTALVAALVEAFSPFGIDNLTVPLGSAAALVLMNAALGK